jgi:hypothetical protein
VFSWFWILVVLTLFVNHLRFPLFLDLMEGTVFQHFQRAANFEPIYTEPSPEFVPLAYNVMYYLVGVPLSWLLGTSLTTLRLVSVVSAVGIGGLVFFIVNRETGSRWWGLIGSGLFAASYFVMDSYLDTAHSDSSFVLFSMAGSAVIRYHKSRWVRVQGLVLLILSFWFKQHGAIFVAGGLLFLTWDEGPLRSWPYWLTALLGGPIAYLFIGPLLFGSHFVYFTYHVPSGWSTVSLHAMLRLGGYFFVYYTWLALASFGWVLRDLVFDRKGLSIWHVQWAAAIGTAILGSLDYGSSNNVFIPAATWIVLCGVLGIEALDRSRLRKKVRSLSYILVVLSFSLVVFNPVDTMRSWRAADAYEDLIHLLKSLDGTVYAPTLGQLPSDYTLYPAAHWVALEDLVRGPGKNSRNHPVIMALLPDLLDHGTQRWILANYPLTRFPWFAYLNDHYVLERDLGDRFRALRTLPGRNDHGWPRYLYRLKTTAEAAEY